MVFHRRRTLYQVSQTPIEKREGREGGVRGKREREGRGEGLVDHQGLSSPHLETSPIPTSAAVSSST